MTQAVYPGEGPFDTLRTVLWDRPEGHVGRVDDGRVDLDTVRGQGRQVVGDGVALGLGDLGTKVAHVDAFGPGGVQGGTDAGDDRHRENAGVQAAGTDDDLVGPLDGVEHLVRRRG